MTGWKTITAAVVSMLYGIGFEGIYNNNWMSAVNYILAGMALFGIGGKLSKIEKK